MYSVLPSEEERPGEHEADAQDAWPRTKCGTYDIMYSGIYPSITYCSMTYYTAID